MVIEYIYCSARRFFAEDEINSKSDLESSLTIERVGSEKDTEVKKLKKSGQLNKKVKKVDIKSEDTSDKVSFANDFKNEIDNNIEEIGDSWIDDI